MRRRETKTHTVTKNRNTIIKRRTHTNTPQTTQMNKHNNNNNNKKNEKNKRKNTKHTQAKTNNNNNKNNNSKKKNNQKNNNNIRIRAHRRTIRRKRITQITHTLRIQIRRRGRNGRHIITT